MAETAYTQLEESWRMHSNINLFLIGSIYPEYWNDRASSKGKSVFAHFAHMHNVRINWMEHIAQELISGISKIPENTEPTTDLLKNAHRASADSISRAIIQSEETNGKIKTFKPHVFAFLAYLISHESHHRGQIMLCLKQSGHPLEKETAMDIWTFNKFINYDED